MRYSYQLDKEEFSEIFRFLTTVVFQGREFAENIIKAETAKAEARAAESRREAAEIENATQANLIRKELDARLNAFSKELDSFSKELDAAKAKAEGAFSDPDIEA